MSDQQPYNESPYVPFAVQDGPYVSASAPFDRHALSIVLRNRGTRLAMLGFDAGPSITLPPPCQTTLMFVTVGSGTADGLAVQERDGIRVEANDQVRFMAEARLELFALGLPRLT